MLAYFRLRCSFAASFFPCLFPIHILILSFRFYSFTLFSVFFIIGINKSCSKKQLHKNVVFRFDDNADRFVVKFTEVLWIETSKKKQTTHTHTPNEIEMGIPIQHFHLFQTVIYMHICDFTQTDRQLCDNIEVSEAYESKRIYGTRCGCIWKWCVQFSKLSICHIDV